MNRCPNSFETTYSHHFKPKSITKIQRITNHIISRGDYNRASGHYVIKSRSKSFSYSKKNLDRAQSEKH